MNRRDAIRMICGMFGVPVVAGALLQLSGCGRVAAESTLRVLPDKCVGCRRCVKIAPHTFKLDPDTEKAKVVNPEGDPPATINEAIRSCPTEAISRR